MGAGGERAARGVRQILEVTQGGGTFDRKGYATISVQLEQTRDQRDAPVIVLGVEITGLQHRAYLGAAEARALRHTITRLLSDAEGLPPTDRH